MNTARLFAAILSVVLVAQDAPQSTVEVRVVDALTGRPVSGATVLASPGIGSRLSNRVGVARFRGVGQGDLNLIAYGAGYLEGGHGVLRPGGLGLPLRVEGAATHEATIRLWPYAVIRGRVTDGGGRPLPGVRVGATGNLGEADEVGFLKTDDRGRFEISLRPGSYAVYVPVWRGLEPTQNWGRSMAGGSGPTAPWVEFSEDGEFRRIFDFSASPPPGDDGSPMEWLSTAHPAATRATDARHVTVGAGERVENVDIALASARRIDTAGSVRLPDGSRAPMRLRFYQRDSLLPSLPIPVTPDLDGHFRLLGVVAGIYDVEAWVAADEWNLTFNRGYFAEGVRVGPHGLDRGIVQLRAPATVHVNVVAPGDAPLRSVDLLSIPGRWGWQSAANNAVITTGPGSYALAPKMSDAYVARATLDGRDVTGRALTLTEGHDHNLAVVLTDQPTTVRGVIGALDQASVEETTVVMFPTEQAKRLRHERLRALLMQRIGPDGRFELLGAPPGDYWVAAVLERSLDGWPDDRLLESIVQRARLVHLAPGRAIDVSLEAPGR